MKMIRNILLLVFGILPASKLKNLLLRICGMRIGPNSRIHPQMIFGGGRITVGENSLIRPFNIFRNVELEMGANAIIGSWNWFSAATALSTLESFRGSLKLGNHSSINSRHYFDCSGGVVIGSYTDVAGIRSTFITHFVDTKEAIQICRPIQIGDYVMMSSNLNVTPGATVGNRSLVAMGTVLTSHIFPEKSFIAGVPGSVKGETSGKYFRRKIGRITTINLDTN
jgi:acetyltransferase-like isoleucine patch superfamily enzyme